MTSRILISVLLLSIIGATQTSGYVPQSDKSIDAFWTKFKTAVSKGDKNTVAQMTIFPVTMPYGVPSIKTRAALLSRYKQVFNGEANAAKCFASAKPHSDLPRAREFEIGCANGSGEEVIIYRFVLTKSGWKFKSLDNINE